MSNEDSETTNEDSETTNEKIEVRYDDLGELYHHKYIVYTDSNGHEYIAHAGPTSKLPPNFGSIKSYYGRAGSTTDLYADWGTRRNVDAREVIEKGTDLSTEWQAIEKAMDAIGDMNYLYLPFLQNSNSVVDTALSRAGLRLPECDDRGENYSPASDHILPPDHDPYALFIPNPLMMPDLPFLTDFFYPPASPLVLDMDGDGIELVALSDSQAMFDLDKDSFAQHTGWVAADDALLAIDRNGNGRIDDIDEVFGNATVDGFTELAALDSNKDGTINASDRFGDLLLWRDANGNGRSEAEELQSLTAGGVKSIALNATASNTTLAGHRISHTSS